ncbi:hypothetical protein COO60DRAFT_1223373 [Scenedesmus sp. NREL 46B-D3]|nr:hypothetical protein COO60DRAFT_1223373 [Scenedesmus sp. NREL 46B-D3]
MLHAFRRWSCTQAVRCLFLFVYTLKRQHSVLGLQTDPCTPAEHVPGDVHPVVVSPPAMHRIWCCALLPIVLSIVMWRCFVLTTHLQSP